MYTFYIILFIHDNKLPKLILLVYINTEALSVHMCNVNNCKIFLYNQSQLMNPRFGTKCTKNRHIYF